METERLDKIETKLAYLERTVTELNIIVTDQEKEIGILQNQVDKLQQKVDDLSEEAGVDRPSQMPPHY